MPRRRNLKPHERSKIIGQNKARVPLKVISKNLDILCPTVQYTVKKSQRYDAEQHDLSYMGRPRHFTQTQDDHLYRYCRINNDLRCSKIEDLDQIK